MKTNIEKLDALAVKTESKWLEKANWRKSREFWLDLSFKISLKILRTLRERRMTQKDLAEKLNVSPQYVNKILKGSENLSLETIANLNQALEIDLLSEIAHYQTTLDDFGRIKVGEIGMKYTSYGSADVFKGKVGIKSTNTFSYNMSGIYYSECEQVAA